LFLLFYIIINHVLEAQLIAEASLSHDTIASCRTWDGLGPMMVFHSAHRFWFESNGCDAYFFITTTFLYCVVVAVKILLSKLLILYSPLHILHPIEVTQKILLKSIMPVFSM